MRFSILIPAKGRPSYLRDAIQSVLLQDDVIADVLVSNNGADPELRDVVARFTTHKNLRYVEQPSILNMPVHWETASRLLQGEYVIVLTDRSLLRQGALRRLASIIDGASEKIDAISWSWDLYYDHLKILLPQNTNSNKRGFVEPRHILSDFAKGMPVFPYALPRGLNSCVHRSVIDQIRSIRGQGFLPVNPDFSFAFSVLCLAKNLYYEPAPLFVSQGLKVSNGSIGYEGDAQRYTNELGAEGEFIFVPIKSSFVQNSIHEDFLRTMAAFRNDAMTGEWNRKAYYLQTIEELRAKREAARLTTARLAELEDGINHALAHETESLRFEVLQEARCQNSVRRASIGFAKRLLRSKIEWLRAITLRFRGGYYCSSAMEAAGFKGR